MSKKQLPGGVRVLLSFLSVLLCIVLFVCSLVTILVADLCVLTSKGGIKELLMDVMFSASAPYRAPVFAPGAVGGQIRLDTPDMGGVDMGGIDFSGLLSGGGADTIADVLYGIMSEQLGGEIPLSKEDVTEFVEQSSLPEFISDKVSGIVSDVINGDVTTTITKDEVVQLLEENKELIEETFQTEIPSEVIESVGQLVEDSKISETIQQGVAGAMGLPVAPDSAAPGETKPSGGTSNPDISQGLDVMDSIVKGEAEDMDFAELMALLRFVTSTEVLLSCIGVCLILSALLFLTNWGRPNAALRCIGIPYLLAGILFLLPTGVATFAPDLFAGMGVAGTVVRKVLSLAGYVSLGVTVLGLVLIIAGAILGSVMKKKWAVRAAETAKTANTEDAVALSEALLAEEVPAENEV